jgi:hypothetical protein
MAVGGMAFSHCNRDKLLFELDTISADFEYPSVDNEVDKEFFDAIKH